MPDDDQDRIKRVAMALYKADCDSENRTAVTWDEMTSTMHVVWHRKAKLWLAAYDAVQHDKEPGR